MTYITQLAFLFLLLVRFTNSQDKLEDCEAGQYFSSTGRLCQFCESPYDPNAHVQTYTYSGDAAPECLLCSDQGEGIGHCTVNKTYCEAGQKFVSRKAECVTCPAYKWSEDGSSHCQHCQNTTVCICDTTSPLNFLPRNDELKEKCRVVNETMICDRECYLQSRHALTSYSVGSISNSVTLLGCTCNNRKTLESCKKRKEFTQQCFQNECDGTRFYDRNLNGTMTDGTTPSTMQITLDSCYKEFRENKTCSRAECVDLLTPFLSDLQTCNCFHTYDFSNQETATTAQCKGWQDFYQNISENCTREPAFSLHPAIITLLVLLVVFLQLLLSGYLAVKYGRYLKRKGSLGNLIRFIDWKRVKPLGAAYEAVMNPNRRNADMLHNKEILLKVRFSVLPWRFGEIKPQHVVLKIFSESQVEQHGVELEVINSIQDRTRARYSNIVSVYGPDRNAGNADLVEFLDTLIKKSTTCAALQDVIKRNYLGLNGDEPPDRTASRCRYIMMNHCNELSLNKFMRTRTDRREQIDINLVKQLCRDLAQALKFLHEINDPHIVHCDIKPDNIFVKRRNNTVTFFLGDFGFAEALSAGRVFTLRGGTPSFYPPEWYLEARVEQNYQIRRNDDAQPGQQIEHSQIQREMLLRRALDPTKIDIYAYGMIVWLALHNASEPWTENYSADWRGRPPRVTREVFLRGLFNNPETFTTRPICVGDDSNNCQDFNVLLTLARDCWQTDCRLRPAASEVLSRDILREEDVNQRRLRYQNVVQHYNINEVQPAVEV